jgi:hypothetical protein
VLSFLCVIERDILEHERDKRKGKSEGDERDKRKGKSEGDERDKREGKIEDRKREREKRLRKIKE